MIDPALTDSERELLDPVICVVPDIFVAVESVIAGRLRALAGDLAARQHKSHLDIEPGWGCELCVLVRELRSALADGTDTPEGEGNG